MVTLFPTRFNTHKPYVLPTQHICVFYVDLRTNSYYFPIQQWLTGFYNRDGLCLLRGTDWICNSNWDWFSTLLQAVSGPPRAVEIRVAPQASPLGIWYTQWYREVFSPSTSVFNCQYHSTIAPYSSGSQYYTYQKHKWAEPRKIPLLSSLQGRRWAPFRDRKLITNKNDTYWWKCYFMIMYQLLQLYCVKSDNT